MSSNPQTRYSPPTPTEGLPGAGSHRHCSGPPVAHPLSGPATAQWYCLRTQSKREHIAAHWLTAYLELETFLPRIRFQRVEPRGSVWFTEALFPNYLFARFQVEVASQPVERVPGIIEIVKFGAHCPSIPESLIEQLREAVGPEQVRVVDRAIVPGEWVQIEHGPFMGLQAVVTQVLPAKERVRVLLELLGRQTSVELSTKAINSSREIRQVLWPEKR